MIAKKSWLKLYTFPDSRSPFLPTSPKEILIDFEPLGKRIRKRTLDNNVLVGGILESSNVKEDYVEDATQSDHEPHYQNKSTDEASGKRSPTSGFYGSDTASPVKQLVSTMIMSLK